MCSPYYNTVELTLSLNSEVGRLYADRDPGDKASYKCHSILCKTLIFSGFLFFVFVSQMKVTVYTQSARNLSNQLLPFLP